MNKVIPLTMLALALVSQSHAAELFNDDFESGSSGFTYVDNGTLNPGAYSISTPGSSGSGSAGHVGDSLSSYSDNAIAAGYIKANSVLADSSQDFSVSVDFKFENEARFDDAMFFIGDLTGGNYYRVGAGENSGTQQLYQISGGTRDASTTATYASTTFTDDTWYSATISWTAATETLSFDSTLLGGSASVVSFSTVLDGTGANNASIASIAAGGVEFGFGTFNDRATFDNIVITGTAIPESSTYALFAGFLGLSAAMIRRHSR